MAGFCPPPGLVSQLASKTRVPIFLRNQVHHHTLACLLHCAMAPFPWDLTTSPWHTFELGSFAFPCFPGLLALLSRWFLPHFRPYSRIPDHVGITESELGQSLVS